MSAGLGPSVGSKTATLAITKAGAGLSSLSCANIFSGLTTVTKGRLLANNTIGFYKLFDTSLNLTNTWTGLTGDGFVRRDWRTLATAPPRFLIFVISMNSQETGVT